jgi:hypothetical protein
MALKFPYSQNRPKLDFVKAAQNSGYTCPTIPEQPQPTFRPRFCHLGTPPWAWRAPRLGALSGPKRHTRTRPNLSKPCESASSTFFYVMGLLVDDLGASLTGVLVRKCETVTLGQLVRVSNLSVTTAQIYLQYPAGHAYKFSSKSESVHHIFWDPPPVPPPCHNTSRPQDSPRRPPPRIRKTLPPPILFFMQLRCCCIRASLPERQNQSAVTRPARRTLLPPGRGCRSPAATAACQACPRGGWRWGC